MNVVTPQTPLGEVLELMQRDGYVLMKNALSPAQVLESVLIRLDLGDSGPVLQETGSVSERFE